MIISAKVRAAALLLRRCAQGLAALDADTMTALIHHLDQCAHDMAHVEANVVVRARPPLPISKREEALIGLVHCAAQQVPAPAALGILSTLKRITAAGPEVLS